MIYTLCLLQKKYQLIIKKTASINLCARNKIFHVRLKTIIVYGKKSRKTNTLKNGVKKLISLKVLSLRLDLKVK